MVTSAELAKRVQDQYPSLAFLLGNPEIRNLLTEATDPNKGFSPTAFQWKLSQTNWWKTQSETQRKWLIQKNTDPEEANRQFRIARRDIQDYAARLGVKLTPNERKLFATWAVTNGWGPDAPKIRDEIIRLSMKPGRREHGAAKTATVAVQTMGRNRYFQTMSSAAAKLWGASIATGSRTIEDAETWYRDQAIKQRPHLAKELKAGMSVADIVNPFRQIVADELEYGDPGRVDVMGNPTWRKLLGIRDPKSKETRLPTESDVIRMARSQAAWWNTSHGRQADAQMGTALLKKFGKVA